MPEVATLDRLDVSKAGRMTLPDLNAEAEKRAERMAWLFEKGGEALDLSEDEATEIRDLNTELTALHKAREGKTEFQAMQAKAAEELERQRKPVGGMIHPQGSPSNGHGALAQAVAVVLTPGQAFVDSESYKAYVKNLRRAGQAAHAEVPALGMKATFTVSGATLTQYERPPGIVLLGQERPTVADLLARGETTMNTVRYMQEDTFTNAATTVAEEGAKPEATFDTSEVDAPVRKIGVTAKVTDELFEDFPAIRDYVDNRLRYMVVMREDAQLISGDGNAPNITGLLNVSGIQTQAKGADPGPDAIYKAMTKVRAVGFFEPDGVIAHPNDWQDIRLLRTADGMYIWGPPTEAGPERVWGKPVVITTGITENTMLVGAFRLGAQVFYRSGVSVEATNTDQDDFVKNRVTIRAEERLALACYRPLAFCSVTGM